MHTEQHIDDILDAAGLDCPLPLLKLKQYLHNMLPEKILKVITTDAGSIRDFSAYIEQSNHIMLDKHIDEAPYIHIIQRGK